MTPNDILTELASLFPQGLHRMPEPEEAELTFPHLSGNDYWYHFAVMPGRYWVGACLADYGAPQPLFWHMPFDSDDSASELELLTHFRKVAFDLLLNKTRITQIRGLVFCTFLCEAFCDGAWTPVYRMHFLRLLRDLPRIAGRRHVYNAPELLVPAQRLA